MEGAASEITLRLRAGGEQVKIFSGKAKSGDSPFVGGASEYPIVHPIKVVNDYKLSARHGFSRFRVKHAKWLGNPRSGRPFNCHVMDIVNHQPCWGTSAH